MISSGTRKISAFIFLAIEIASFAVGRVRSVSVFPSFSEADHTVLSSLLVVALLVDIIHQRWIHDPWLYSFQDIQEKEASFYARVLERANCLHARFAFLCRRVGPLEHLGIADGSTLAGF